MCQYVNHPAVHSAANWHIDKSAHWQIIPIHDFMYKSIIQIIFISYNTR